MTPLMPISSPEEERPRRRRRARGWRVPLEEGEKHALVSALTERVLPTSDFFLFILLSAILACLGFALHSTTLLVAAALVAPLFAPLAGISFGLASSLAGYVGRNLLGVFLGMALAFLAAALMGAACRLILPSAQLVAAASPGVNWVDLVIALVASLWMASRLARKPGEARLPSAVLSYLVLIPVMAAGWNWAWIGPQASQVPILSALATLFLAIVGSQLMFLFLGVRPSPESLGVWASVLGAIISIDLCVLALVGLGSRSPLALAARPVSTPQPSLILAPTRTASPSPTVAPTETALPSLTPTPTSQPAAAVTSTPIPVAGVIYGTKGKGAMLRDQPAGTVVSSLEEGVEVQMIGESQSVAGLDWALVRDAQGHQGWLALQFFATVTPTPAP